MIIKTYYVTLKELKSIKKSFVLYSSFTKGALGPNFNFEIMFFFKYSL